MMKRALIIKKRLGLIIFSALLITFISVMAYAGEGRFAFSDLTATDKITGLMWTKDANIAKERITWKDAHKFIERLNKQKYAGHSDWRLPTKKEFQILLAYAESQGYATPLNELLNKIGFINVLAGKYWSSSTYANLTSAAWFVHMSSGIVYVDNKAVTYYVWPVRGGR